MVVVPAIGSITEVVLYVSMFSLVPPTNVIGPRFKPINCDCVSGLRKPVWYDALMLCSRLSPNDNTPDTRGVKLPSKFWFLS